MFETSPSLHWKGLYDRDNERLSHVHHIVNRKCLQVKHGYFLSEGVQCALEELAKPWLLVEGDTSHDDVCPVAVFLGWLLPAAIGTL